MLLDIYAGETVRITAKNLTFTDVNGVETKVTAGATVTIVIVNPDGTQLSSDPATANGNDWSILKTMPTVVGLYTVKITDNYSGATGKELGKIRVKGF
jgi:hypothetical protein